MRAMYRHLVMKKPVLSRLCQKIPTVKFRPHLNDDYRMPYPPVGIPVSKHCRHPFLSGAIGANEFLLIRKLQT